MMVDIDEEHAEAFRSVHGGRGRMLEKPVKCSPCMNGNHRGCVRNKKKRVGVLDVCHCESRECGGTGKWPMVPKRAMKPKGRFS